MSWEIQFRKKESELDLKLTSLQNLSPESDSTHLENEIDNLLDQLNQVVNKADSSSATSSSSKIWKNLWFPGNFSIVSYSYDEFFFRMILNFWDSHYRIRQTIAQSTHHDELTSGKPQKKLE